MSSPCQLVSGGCEWQRERGTWILIFIFATVAGYFVSDAVMVYLTGDSWLFYLCVYHHIVVSNFVIKTVEIRH